MLALMLVPLSWLAMQVVHELGHVVHAWLSGGEVQHVVLRPTELSRTDVQPNPHPQFVAWGGVFWGSLLPLSAVSIVRRVRPALTNSACFFAGFCLIANGAYLLGGSLTNVGDAADLMRHGVGWRLLFSIGLGMAAGGLFCWHHSGVTFRLRGGPAASFGHIVELSIALLVLVLLEYALASPSMN